uniref:Uncharacterized protein n=1 Tax=Ciona intestinalis TaxID=7719 RepID=H2XP24_CIOIN
RVKNTHLFTVCITTPLPSKFNTIFNLGSDLKLISKYKTENLCFYLFHDKNFLLKSYPPFPIIPLLFSSFSFSKPTQLLYFPLHQFLSSFSFSSWLILVHFPLRWQLPPPQPQLLL